MFADLTQPLLVKIMPLSQLALDFGTEDAEFATVMALDADPASSGSALSAVAIAPGQFPPAQAVPMVQAVPVVQIAEVFPRSIAVTLRPTAEIAAHPAASEPRADPSPPQDEDTGVDWPLDGALAVLSFLIRPDTPIQRAAAASRADIAEETPPRATVEVPHQTVGQSDDALPPVPLPPQAAGDPQQPAMPAAPTSPAGLHTPDPGVVPVPSVARLSQATGPDRPVAESRSAPRQVLPVAFADTSSQPAAVVADRSAWPVDSGLPGAPPLSRSAAEARTPESKPPQTSKQSVAPPAGPISCGVTFSHRPDDAPPFRARDLLSVPIPSAARTRVVNIAPTLSWNPHVASVTSIPVPQTEKSAARDGADFTPSESVRAAAPAQISLSPLAKTALREPDLPKARAPIPTASAPVKIDTSPAVTSSASAPAAVAVPAAKSAAAGAQAKIIHIRALPTHDGQPDPSQSVLPAPDAASPLAEPKAASDFPQPPPLSEPRLAPAVPTISAANSAPVPPQPAALMAQILRHHDVAKPHAVELILAPEDLGKLRFQFNYHGDTLRIVLMAERPDTADLIRRNADQLAQEFRQAGFSDATIDLGQWHQQGSSGRQTATPSQSETAEQQTLSLRPAPPPRLAAIPSQGLDVRL